VAGRRNSTAGRRTAGWLAASKLYYAVTDARLTKKMPSPRVWPQEVPAVSLEIQKDCKSAVRFIARRRHELHTSGEHALVRRIEIVDAQEQPDATGELLPYDAFCWSPSGRARRMPVWPPLGRMTTSASIDRHWSVTVCLPPS
jgi:hypothetical protein